MIPVSVSEYTVLVRSEKEIKDFCVVAAVSVARAAVDGPDRLVLRAAVVSAAGMTVCVEERNAEVEPGTDVYA